MGFSENSRAPRDNSPGRQARQITRGIDLTQCKVERCKWSQTTTALLRTMTRTKQAMTKRLKAV